MAIRRGLGWRPSVLSYGATRSLSQSAASAAELSELSGVTAAPWLSAPWSLHPPKRDKLEMIQLPLLPVEHEMPSASVSGWQSSCDSRSPFGLLEEMTLPSGALPTCLGDNGRHPLPVPHVPAEAWEIDGANHNLQPVIAPPPLMDEPKPTLGDPMQNSGGAVPLLCFKYAPKRRKSQGLEEKWWLEFDPPKNNYLGGQGRGPFGGNSITKSMWQRQMVPIRYNQRWERRERNRFAFRKNGFEVDVPKYGG